jgi:gamma-glutamyltranspeptidase/glutathione hydrolase
MRDFHMPGRSAVFAMNGLCATSNPVAAAAAVDILKAGGNAMDAAIAGAVLLGVAEPQMTGIGGDCFALIAPAGGGDVVAVNGSGRAPAGADAALLREAGHETVPADSPYAITVPGAIDAFCAMSARFGRLGIADSLAPAIRYMDEGLPVAPRTAFDWALEQGVLRNEAALRHFLPGGAAPAVGTPFRMPGNAEVLRRVARDGRDGFYTGEVAEDMLAALHAAGGPHTEADFAATQTTFDTPVSADYKGKTLVEHPPNGQGVIAHLMLNMLGHFDIASMDPFGPDRLHLETEVAKLAYDARNRYLSDPSTMGDGLARLASAEMAERLAGLIDMKKALPAKTEVIEAVHRDTIYITVVDKDRMAVSLIYSIFHGFGSGLASDKFGILFHNRGAGFTAAEGHPNELAPGKRPLHTIIPAMVAGADGRIEMPFGVMGGQYQAAGHARVMTNMLDFGMDAQAALDAPRSFPEDGALKLERGIAENVRAELAARGHAVTVPEMPIGGAQAIVIRPDGVLEGASDPRKDGAAIGY